MEQHRKVILYIAMSVDGYIAKLDDDLAFLSIVEQEGQDYGYFDFLETVDTVIMGRKTYSKVLAMGYEAPHNDKDTYIITRTPQPNIGNIKFYTNGLKELITSLKQAQGANIFIDGGAEIVHELLKDNLIDEFYISIIPILLGEGIALFKGGRQESHLKLVEATSFEKGLVQLHYARTGV